MSTLKTPTEIATETLPSYIGDSDTSDGFDRADMISFATVAVEADRAQHTESRTVISESVIAAISDAVDRAKMDDRSLDTDEYVAIILDALASPPQPQLPDDTTVTFGLELGIDVPGEGRVFGADVGPFPHLVAAIDYAKQVAGTPLRGVLASPLADRAASDPVDDDRVIAGATVYAYTDREGTQWSEDVITDKLT